jgi:uncharacterized protein
MPQPQLKRRLIRIALIVIFLPPLLSAAAGWLVAPSYLHPIRRELTPDLIREADTYFREAHATREDFKVSAPDGVLLKGWKVRPAVANGSWVLLFHGVADNRVGVVGQASVLLKAGYSIVMMDSRAHGASGGLMASYGWLERDDTRAVVDALLASELDEAVNVQTGGRQNLQPMPRISNPFHLFALGESMGAGIALQAAAVEPRIEAVAAEASFANLREASYDYAGLRRSPFIGKTWLSPFSWVLLYRGQQLAGVALGKISPEQAVASRAFPVLLICDQHDEALPCRHSERIYSRARGPKQLWVVPGAFHTAALGYQPAEFQRRVVKFYEQVATQAETVAAH